MSKFRIPIIDKFSWQEPIMSFISEIPASINPGERYIIINNQSVNHNQIISCDDTNTYRFAIPNIGWQIYCKNDSKFYIFVNNEWKANISVPDGSEVVNWILKSNEQKAFNILTDTRNDILSIDTTTDNQKIIFNTDANFSSYLSDNDGNNITINELNTAISSLPKYDLELGTLIFDDLIKISNLIPPNNIYNSLTNKPTDTISIKSILNFKFDQIIYPNTGHIELIDITNNNSEINLQTINDQNIIEIDINSQSIFFDLLSFSLDLSKIDEIEYGKHYSLKLSENAIVNKDNIPVQLDEIAFIIESKQIDNTGSSGDTGSSGETGGTSGTGETGSSEKLVLNRIIN